jgi:branched-chain amino acid transport system substrate-binding protein
VNKLDFLCIENFKKEKTKMKKMLMYLLLGMLILVMLVGCGGAAPTQSTSGGSQPQTGKDPIILGLQAPITGNWAYEGEMAKKSAETAAKLINDKGGILGGRKIQIQVADDASNPKDSALAAQKLVAQKVVAVVGSYGSSVTVPAADIYEQNKLVDIGYGCTAVSLTMDKERKYFFRTCGRDDSQGQFFGQFAVEKLAAKRIAIMHDNTTFAKGVADEAQKALKKYVDEGKAEIVYFDAITPGEKDFNAALTKLRETKPDVWYFTGYYPEAGLLIRQGRDAGIKCPFVGGNAAVNDDFVKIAGIDYAKGALMTQEPLPSDLTTPISKDFLAAYKTAYGDIPSSPWPIYAADGVYALAWAIDKAGSTEPDKIVDALHTKMNGSEGVTGPMSFSDRGDRVGVPYFMYIVKDDGKFGVYNK